MNLSNYTDLIKAIKKASLEVVESSKPVNVVFGKVTSASPLKIQIDQKITLGAAQLVLCRNVTDFEDEITVIDWNTENESGGGGDDSFASHNHALKGRKKIIVHNKLRKGDEVVLIREQGGQKYIVIDRLAVIE